MKSALVTGGLGFIGSHLVDRLLATGWRVVVFDNLTTGDAANLEHQQSNPRLTVVEEDVRDLAALTAASEGCDAVFHLAAHALMRKSVVDQKVDLDVNLLGTLNVVESMIDNHVKDLVFASTSALYGVSEVLPTPESYAGIQTSLYGAAKLAAEAFAAAYVQLAPINFWAFRFGTVLGERCRRGAIWDFVHKLRENPAELEILGDGKQRKDYLYVKDCVEGMMLGYEKSRQRVNIFNLGLEEQTSVDQLADIVIRGMDLTDVRRKYAGGDHGWIGDNPVVYLSIQKIRALGWRPTLTAQETIELTTRWTREELESVGPALPRTIAAGAA